MTKVRSYLLQRHQKQVGNFWDWIAIPLDSQSSPTIQDKLMAAQWQRIFLTVSNVIYVKATSHIHISKQPPLRIPTSQCTPIVTQFQHQLQEQFQCDAVEINCHINSQNLMMCATFAISCRSKQGSLFTLVKDADVAIVRALRSVQC